MGKRILVTPRSVTLHGHPQLGRLREAGFEVVFSKPGMQPGEPELMQLLPGCAGYLAGVEKITARVLEAATELRVISRNGTGVDNVDLAAAQRRGIQVCRAVGANARGVAELALALILALARSIPFTDRSLKAGGWDRRHGFELKGRTLGLVGCGNIGRLLARFALGLDIRVLAYDVVPDPAFAPGGKFAFAPLAQVLGESDIVSLHCPSQAGGRPVIDGAALAAMKRGVLLVNTARADLIDRAALADALASGQVGGVGLDVFSQEPPGPDPLLQSDRVICTAHIGGFTRESVDRAVEVAVDNLIEHLRS